MWTKQMVSKIISSSEYEEIQVTGNQSEAPQSHLVCHVIDSTYLIGLMHR